MYLKLLDKQQIEHIYYNHMVSDFPKNELKPLSIILQSINLGFYKCLGVFDEDIIEGYVFLVKLNNTYLIDYIAIFPELRNMGVGSNLLTLINEYLTTADYIIGEVEDPAYTEDKEQKILQKRRLGFYLRNNCIDTGLRVECFGVNYIILTSDTQINNINKDAIWDMYSDFYKRFLTDDKFEKNIKRIY